MSCTHQPDKSSEAGIRARSEAQRERRERIATHVLAGFASALERPEDASAPYYVDLAVEWTDLLMARLDATATQDGK